MIKIRFFTVFLFCSFISWNQQLTVYHVDSLLDRAQEKYDLKDYHGTIEICKTILNLNLSHLNQPNKKDLKLTYYIKYEYPFVIINQTRLILGESYFSLKSYDSSIVYLNQIQLPNNINSIRNFTSGIVVQSQIALTLSQCYEALNQKQTAIDVLLPLLFIDLDLSDEKKKNNHVMLIKRLKKLGFKPFPIDSSNIYLDTSEFSENIYGYLPFHPLIYYQYHNIKLYIVAKSDLIKECNSCFTTEQIDLFEQKNHRFLTEKEIEHHRVVNKACLAQMLLKFDFFKIKR